MLHPHQRDDGVGMEQPAAEHLQHLPGQPVAQPAIDALRGDDHDRRCDRQRDERQEPAKAELRKEDAIEN